MKRIVLVTTATVLGLSAFFTARTFSASGPLLKFTIHQSSTLQSEHGEATTFHQKFVQREDGTYARAEIHYIIGRGVCEGGTYFTSLARVTYNTCTKAKSTYAAKSEVYRQNQLRKQPTCVDVFGSGKLINRGEMFGMRTEEFAYDDDAQKGLVVVSPDLACMALSEVHQWKREDGTLSGALTSLMTISLSSEVDEHPFTVAKDLREMKPSEARNLWAHMIGNPTAAECFQKVNSKLDERYGR
jgi:hypothetical protein